MGAHYISMGCLFNKSGKVFKYTCLERGSCLPGKGVVDYPNLEQGCQKCIFVNDMKHQR